MTTALQIFPYPYLHQALASFQKPVLSYEYNDMYVRIASRQVGVTRYSPGEAYDGYTLFTSGDSTAAYLINMSGQLVHEWRLPYDQVWNSTAAVKSLEYSKFAFWRSTYLYPNGDLLAVYEDWTDHPFGYGLVKMDRNSRPLWTFLEHVHHSVAVGDDGRIYTLSHRIMSAPVNGLPRLGASYYEDFVDVLSPDGVLLKQVSLLQAFANSPFGRLIELQRNDSDPLHTNSVRPVPAEWAHKMGLKGSNYVLLSFRLLDSIALLDLDAGKIAWIQHGPFARQHSVSLLQDGDVTAFDNVGDMAHGARSRAIEFSVDPFKIIWEFPGNSGETLSSGILGTVERLPNRNTLITEADGGRLLEVTPADRVVWEYRTPFRYGDQNQYIAVILGAHRYGADDLHFEFNHQPLPPGSQPANGRDLHEATLEAH